MLLGILVLVYLGRDYTAIIDAPMPAIDLMPILNTEFQPTNESVAGKVTVYHFWGTWCPPCREEFPEYAELASSYQNANDVVFLTVSCSSGPEYDIEPLKEETKDYLQTLNVNLPVYADPAMFTRAQIAKVMAAGGFEYPMTLVVDQTGVVRDFWRGYLPKNMPELKTKIESLRNQ